MGFYETTYILHSALQEGRLHDIVSAIENKVKSLGAEILYSDTWGRKKMAYLINKEKYGTYIFLQFKLKNSDKLPELSAEFEHNPNILRYLNIKIDEEDIMESKEEKKSSNHVPDTDDKPKEKISEDDASDEAKKEEK
mgnify:CR=1 FL=1